MPISDYMEWEINPRELSKEEIANPYLVISDLFDYSHLPNIRESLWEWLKATVTGCYSKYMDRDQRYDLLYFYEKIQKLVEAAHLIHLQKGIKDQENEAYETDCPLPAAVKEPIPCPELIKPTLEKIIAATEAEKIFLTSCYLDGDINLKGHACYDLLTLLPGTANQPLEEYQKLLELAPEGVTITGRFLKSDEVYKRLREGNIYYTLYLTEGNLIYQSSNEPWPTPSPDNFEAAKQQAETVFSEVMGKAQGFLEGTSYHLQQNQLDLASFMLHQATELGYRALLLSLTTHNYTTHNLYKLRRKCMALSPAIGRVFSLDSEEENNLYLLLQKAYVKARYKEDYHIENADLEVLLRRVKDFHLLIKEIFEKKLISFEKATGNLSASLTESSDYDEPKADRSCSEQDFHQL